MNHNEEQEALQEIEREYKCKIDCEIVREFDTPAYDMKYTVEGVEYISYRTLDSKGTGKYDGNYGCECDRIVGYTDSYGRQVVLLVHEIPCFDSEDRMYDQYHLLFFFHNEKHLHALYCREGYRISVFRIFENVTVLSEELKQLLASEGFPV